jgi:hypothetical protein
MKYDILQTTSMKAKANLANNTGEVKKIGHDASILRPPKRRFLFYVVFTPPKQLFRK